MHGLLTLSLSELLLQLVFTAVVIGRGNAAGETDGSWGETATSVRHTEAHPGTVPGSAPPAASYSANVARVATALDNEAQQLAASAGDREVRAVGGHPPGMCRVLSRPMARLSSRYEAARLPSTPPEAPWKRGASYRRLTMYE